MLNKNCRYSTKFISIRKYTNYKFSTLIKKINYTALTPIVGVKLIDYNKTSPSVLRTRSGTRIARLYYNKIDQDNELSYPSTQEWKDNIYTYNKNYIKTISFKNKLANDIMKGYFNLNPLFGKKKSKRIELRNRRLSLNKIHISKLEMKHTNDKVTLTVYLYNKNKKFLLSKLNKLLQTTRNIGQGLLRNKKTLKYTAKKHNATHLSRELDILKKSKKYRFNSIKLSTRQKKIFTARKIPGLKIKFSLFSLPRLGFDRKTLKTHSFYTSREGVELKTLDFYLDTSKLKVGVNPSLLYNMFNKNKINNFYRSYALPTRSNTTNTSENEVSVFKPKQDILEIKHQLPNIFNTMICVKSRKILKISRTINLIKFSSIEHVKRKKIHSRFNKFVLITKKRVLLMKKLKIIMQDKNFIIDNLNWDIHNFSDFKMRYYKKFLNLVYKKERLYIYYMKMLRFNNNKFKNWFLLGLKNQLSNIFNKKIEFNFVNLKYLYLNSDIFSESISIKLSNRKHTLNKVLKKALNLVKYATINSNNNYKEKSSNLVNKNNNGIFLNKNQDSLNLILYKNFRASPYTFINLNHKNVNNNYIKIEKSYGLNSNDIGILQSIKNKSVLGVRLEAAGRLSRRLTASRSIFKLKYRGSIKNYDSSVRGKSSPILKGNIKSNLQYSKISGKTRNGAFGLKGWISS